MTRLIWLIGPSGAGKDSLLAALRHQQIPELLVAHRYITRPADAGGENHIALSDAEFSQRAAGGLFALAWQANGYRYGLGIELDQWLATGMSVIVNGSRQHLPHAMERYGNQLLPVMLQVSNDVLRRRLETRGRETSDAIEQRLRRAGHFATHLPHCAILNNDGSLLQSVTALIQLIRHPPEEKPNVC